MAKQQAPPDLPPPAPERESPSVQAESAAERARLRARRGRSSTILTQGLGGGGEEGTTSLLGGNRA
jgi:hypothetical protein